MNAPCPNCGNLPCQCEHDLRRGSNRRDGPGDAEYDGSDVRRESYDYVAIEDPVEELQEDLLPRPEGPKDTPYWRGYHAAERSNVQCPYRGPDKQQFYRGLSDGRFQKQVRPKFKFPWD